MANNSSIENIGKINIRSTVKDIIDSYLEVIFKNC